MKAFVALLATVVVASSCGTTQDVVPKSLAPQSNLVVSIQEAKAMYETDVINEIRSGDTWVRMPGKQCASDPTFSYILRTVVDVKNTSEVPLTLKLKDFAIHMKNEKFPPFSYSEKLGDIPIATQREVALNVPANGQRTLTLYFAAYVECAEVSIHVANAEPVKVKRPELPRLPEKTENPKAGSAQPQEVCNDAWKVQVVQEAEAYYQQEVMSVIIDEKTGTRGHVMGTVIAGEDRYLLKIYLYISNLKKKEAQFSLEDVKAACDGTMTTASAFIRLPGMVTVMKGNPSFSVGEKSEIFCFLFPVPEKMTRVPVTFKDLPPITFHKSPISDPENKDKRKKSKD